MSTMIEVAEGIAKRMSAKARTGERERESRRVPKIETEPDP